MKHLLKKTGECEYAIDKDSIPGMNVGAKLFASEKILEGIDDKTIEQLSNAAKLPGLAGPVVAMPDTHVGYGLPVGAVAAFRKQEGVISAGMVGFDINCGINLLRTEIPFEDLKRKLKELADELFRRVPTGVGSKSRLRLSKHQLDEVLLQGGRWLLEKGYVSESDIRNHEENSVMEGADPSKVSQLAKERGMLQLGTLGAGNHFLEIQKVDEIFDENIAHQLGMEKGQAAIMIHSGSRGLGHQVASDYLKIHEAAARKYGLSIPDRQLACAPAESKEGQDYFSAMKCAVNYAFANRLMITHYVREAFRKLFGQEPGSLGLETVYGIAHNICKLEEHIINGKKQEAYVHRKGATRSFPGTPVIIAGSMGTPSYLMQGTETAMEKSYGSSCHGSGRVMSRTQAIKSVSGERVIKDLEKKGEIIMAASRKGVAEEAPQAYKNVDDVIDTVARAGLSKRLLRLCPILVIKG